MVYTPSFTSAAIPYKYDVFLCFRGEDTRYSFTDHLYKALHEAGIRTFRDEDEIHEGNELKPKIKRSITKSRASIIVFSKNFANSTWCLDELSLILQQKRKGLHFILPVFYGVDPSHVRNQRGSFTIEAKKEVGGLKWTQNNVNRWKATLNEVANLKGMVVSGYETAFIPLIVEKIYRKLDLKLQSTLPSLTGIETRAQVVESWLRSKQNDHPVLAICGMGGSGKTTLAKHIYYSNKLNFFSCSFLEDIEKHPDGLLGVQKQLLKDVARNNSIMISNVYEGALQLEKAIQMNRVLIVVDDIDDKDNLITLFGTKVFPTQSKIIITTRHLNVDTWFKSISCGCHVHEIDMLNDNESLELLCCHAFGSKVPMEGFEQLAVQLAQYCEGNLLALTVLGSSLSVGSQDKWIKNNMIRSWRNKVNSLNSTNGHLGDKIQGVLQRSFESLPCDSDKDLFLHIACFSIGERLYNRDGLVENDPDMKFGIMTLINRCLLTISKDSFKRLKMHRLLQDMAKKIVDADSKDPARRSRVWRHDESYCLLKKGHGSKSIEGLSLDMLEAEQNISSEAFETSSIIKMKNLKFLQLNYVRFTGSYKNFPDVRWLRWHHCNLKRIPLGLLMNSLVALHMSFGDLEEFEVPLVLNSLKFLDLSFSCKLVSINNIHRLPKLMHLHLQGCTSLIHVCKTIKDLNNLSFVDFGGCPKLLQALFNCKQIAEQSPLFSLPQSSRMWSLASNPFEILPNYVDIKMLQMLNLSGCSNLKDIPCLPSTLKVLNVYWCSSLERITFESSRFTLQEFDYEGCLKLSDIEGLFKLVSIAKLSEADLGHMQWVKAYQDHKVDLVGDVITMGRTWNIQMLYEYGIRSTYLQDIKDQSMRTHEYTSSSDSLSFHVPLHLKNHKIQGVNVTVVYKSPCKKIYDWPPLFAQMTNRTKGITWVYNPVVYCKPKVDSDVLWLSYWPIGDLLDANDEVYVCIIVEEGTIIITEFGASIVYMNDGEVKKEQKCERIKGELEVIGGDLSLFEVTKGSYYLCRRDFFQSSTPDKFKMLFGDNNLYKDSRRWRLSAHSGIFYQEANTFRNPDRIRIEVEFGVSFNDESEIERMEKAVVSSIMGVETISIRKQARRIVVRGCFDVEAVVRCVREFEMMVQVLDVKGVVIERTNVAK